VREAVGLLLRVPEKRNEDQEADIQALAVPQPEIGRTVTLFEVTLFEWFAHILRSRESEQLEEWMAEAEGTGITDMR
jgi:hypothetical protein